MVIRLNSLDELKPGYQQKRQSKYGNKITYVDGIRFMSEHEAERYAELKKLERIGAIKSLQLQPKYDIIINGIKVCTYIADFAYLNIAQLSTRALGYKNEHIIEDAKSKATKKDKVYRLKKKLVEAQYGIKIIEI